jgi:hypothetical protein
MTLDHDLTRPDLPREARAGGTARALRAQTGPLVACLVTGVVLGLTWSLLAQRAGESWATSGESLVAGDGVLALLGTVAGILTALLLAVRQGAHPAARATVVLLGTVVGAGVAWATGLLVGAPDVRATGVVLAWPAVTALLTAVRSLVGSTRSSS